MDVANTFDRTTKLTTTTLVTVRLPQNWLIPL